MRACWLVSADRKGNLQTKASLVQSLYRRRFLRIVNACINISSQGLGIGMSAKLEVWRGGGGNFHIMTQKRGDGETRPTSRYISGARPPEQRIFQHFVSRIQFCIFEIKWPKSKEKLNAGFGWL